MGTEHQTTEDGEAIAYIRQMLGELHQVAHKQGADMLCYLIEMAYVEAGDVQSGRRPRSIGHGERNKSTGVTI
ncbi:hypothetical protein LH464_04670 [Neorhizobium sp. T786]|uniref:hypothetical protein n=1 Tax=Pseudorhizobium xiangyangii TaxID=2883104 RepID=UPI001D000823|nr:hypothetical protein [Neorhizobium xiangyangii]MCB5201772.1 hypothetical protein [Neorhizobium xiangyangii]